MGCAKDSLIVVGSYFLRGMNGPFAISWSCLLYSRIDEIRDMQPFFELHKDNFTNELGLMSLWTKFGLTSPFAISSDQVVLTLQRNGRGRRADDIAYVEFYKILEDQTVVYESSLEFKGEILSIVPYGSGNYYICTKTTLFDVVSQNIENSIHRDILTGETVSPCVFRGLFVHTEKIYIPWFDGITWVLKVLCVLYPKLP
jgi:hypothetical protein